ncbi:hypothetical protein [Nocardia carnea]|uniref:Uncharacterized protein n=1 Tax=Nocardia carnea TaxID=37328 RepID=A0ABW7TSQ3_9NOCA|nr:hypothetical protein [Nocardia carnea]
MRIRTPLITLAVPLGCLVFGAGTASAVTTEQAPNTVTVNFTDVEARMIDALDLGPVLGALPPNFTPEAKQRLGENLAEYAGRAARTPGSTLSVIIDQPVGAPPGIGVTVIP